MNLDEFVKILAEKYGRQNPDMHLDFPSLLQKMRKELKRKKSTSRFMGSVQN